MRWVAHEKVRYRIGKYILIRVNDPRYLLSRYRLSPITVKISV